MTTEQIKEQLKFFEEKILNSNETNPQYWLNIEKEFNIFLKNNNLKSDELESFLLSGAGEMLYMICSGLKRS